MKIRKIDFIYVLILFGLASCTSIKMSVKTNEPKIKKTKRINPDISLPVEIREFDTQGNLLVEEKYDKNSKLSSGTKYTYNKYDDIISSYTYYVPQITKMKLPDSASKYDYTYYKDGRMKSRFRNYQSSNYKEHTTFLYEKGVLVKELTDIESRGKESTRTVTHKYNEVDKIDTTIQYSNEELYKLLVYKYDEKNMLLESIDTRYREGKVDYSMVEEFDEGGKLISKISRTQTEKTIEKYNSTGQAIRWQTYDEYGKLILDDSCKYELDKIGNWVSCECTRDGKLGSITTREIEYYK